MESFFGGNLYPASQFISAIADHYEFRVMNGVRNSASDRPITSISVSKPYIATVFCRTYGMSASTFVYPDDTGPFIQGPNSYIQNIVKGYSERYYWKMTFTDTAIQLQSEETNGMNSSILRISIPLIIAYVDPQYIIGP